MTKLSIGYRVQGTGYRATQDGSSPRTLYLVPRTAPSALLALCMLLATGCLPSSQRQTDRSISAADSASVALEATVPVDTLALAWEAAARADDPMPLPTTIGWLFPDSSGAQLVVVETQQGSVRLFTPSGRQGKHVATGGGAAAYPYLAGTRGDSAAVLERGASQLAFVPLDSSGAVRRIPVPAGASAAFVTDTSIVVRTGGGADAAPAFLSRLDERGRVVARHPLRGPPWRGAGFVRPWGDRVLALSGYRPVVDVLRPGRPTGAALDTLALVGFASPELSRSAQFMRGDVDQPPLLASSAAALGDRLFVLNMRDDHIRVDVYGRGGRLERVLVSARPWQSLAYVPVDLAVRQTDLATEIAVLMQRPSGLLQKADSRVVLYRWKG